MVARRRLLTTSLGIVAGGVITGGVVLGDAASGSSPGAEPAVPTSREPADQVLARLMAGNARWASGRIRHRPAAAQRRRRVAAAQAPVAVVLGCIDSRVPPEFVFDQDLGDLYVVRTAGGCLDPLVTGSLEYGPHTGTPVVLVLGHQRCGAITATVASIETGEPLPGNLAEVVRALAPAYELAIRELGGTALAGRASRAQRVQATTLAQIRRTVAELARDPLLRSPADPGATRIAGGCYSLDTGVVQLVASA